MMHLDSDAAVEAAVNVVWQSLPSDRALKAIRPEEFFERMEDLGLSDADAEEAWDRYSARVTEVFGR